MKIDSTLVRYVLVGMVNTLFGYSIFALLSYLGLHYAVALFIVTIAGILFNFQTLGRLVFKKSDWRLLWRFLAVYGLLYIINVSSIFVLMKYINNVYLANAITLMFIVSLGFLLNRRFVYANN